MSTGSARHRRDRAATLVTVSAGTTISAEDIRQFNFQWMQPDQCAAEVAAAAHDFLYRQPSWDIAERTNA